jgi:uncharacterized protein
MNPIGEHRASHARPRVSLLYNPTTPELLAYAGSLVEHLSVMPDRLWFDHGIEQRQARFRLIGPALDELQQVAAGRPLSGHGLGLSLPSAMPLDEAMVQAVDDVAGLLGGFGWHSEHLNLFLTPQGGVPNAQAGLGLPVVYDDEAFEIIATKLQRLKTVMGCPQLLENGSFFTPVPDQPMSEPRFLGRLYREGHAGMLLDLHNLVVNARNGGIDPVDYLADVDLEAVVEAHIAGGDELNGFYMDSHATTTPEEVWALAHEWLPRCPRLRAITFEYQESYFEDIGLQRLGRELERMHVLAEACRAPVGCPDAG